ncbi:uncharacterized protein LOC110047065 [Orbicella faveolata]|uniref:uncharacterized protein LOC110047065 n=1 Tax=Orbicella faveolata TaxID=48498 RepID=UPI0009E38B12|nr:uncharacterized protein LOC110047065 [Orbicella faveolata]
MSTKMKPRCLNTFFISAVFLILFVPEGFSMECYTCTSSKSWEDCLETSRIFKCENLYSKSPAADLVCLSVVRSKLRTWNQQITHYATFCSTKDMCDEAACERDMLQRNEYNITKARRCNIECCPEDKCNGKLNVLNLAEVTEDMSKGEVPFISCLCVITLALASFILGNN